MASTKNDRIRELLQMRSVEIVGIYQRLTDTKGIEPAVIFSVKIDLIPRIVNLEFPSESPCSGEGVGRSDLAATDAER
jgi:hypothetical protein